MNNKIQENQPNMTEVTSTQECEYCKTFFVPKRRFIQKYCSESCRVMACRERKENAYSMVVSGQLSNKRNTTTNTELKKTLDKTLELMNNQQLHYKMDKELDTKMRELDVKEINMNIKKVIN